MKLIPNAKFPPGRNADLSPQPRRMAADGFTLVEMMIASAIFIMMIGALVCLQIFGLRIYTLASTKLTATQSARETLNNMRDAIRESQQVYVGTFTNGVFTQAVGLQIGNALQAFTTTNTASTNFIVFYQDPTTNEIFSYVNTPLNDLTVLATYETNYLCFDAEDYQGIIQSNYVNNPVISVTLSFSQWEYPIGFVGTNALNAFDYYFVRPHIARRCKQ
jgi:prepilin-type N-terminal cleavage/methylation domain-containing protein